MKRAKAILLSLVLTLLTASCLSTQVYASESNPKPVTLLLGPWWLGLWQNGRFIHRVEFPGWQFTGVRFKERGRVVEASANLRYPRNDEDSDSFVFRFSTRTLSLLKKYRDRRPEDWPPIGRWVISAERPEQFSEAVGPGFPPGAKVVDKLRRAMLLAFPAPRNRTALQLFSLDGKPVGAKHLLMPGDWRAAISPDGSTLAAFVQTSKDPKAPWKGSAWHAKTGQPIRTPPLSINNESPLREEGTRRALACVLPRGEGIFFTYDGLPADIYSEYQAFGPGAKGPRDLTPLSVYTCMELPRQ